VKVLAADAKRMTRRFNTRSPHSFYGCSKYEGEKIVHKLWNRYMIWRVGWIFGSGPKDKKSVAKIIDRDKLMPHMKALCEYITETLLKTETA
jgi:dTDP-4-dehydrorhamnose reductase